MEKYDFQPKGKVWVPQRFILLSIYQWRGWRCCEYRTVTSQWAHRQRRGVGTPEWGHRPMTHQLGSLHGFLNLPRFPHAHNGDDYTVEGVGPLWGLNALHMLPSAQSYNDLSACHYCYSVFTRWTDRIYRWMLNDWTEIQEDTAGVGKVTEWHSTDLEPVTPKVQQRKGTDPEQRIKIPWYLCSY